MAIKNIIFDLGGVIINIDYSLSSQAFKRLGALEFDDVFTQAKQDHLFDQYETGQIDCDRFRSGLMHRLGIAVTREAFDSAWNAMLLDLPKERLDYLIQLKDDYRLFLFSNINPIHMNQVGTLFQGQYHFDSLEPYFERAYYSHEFGKRKPHPESFTAILNENQLKPEETLFIDDTRQHIEGAIAAGLQTFHMVKGKSIFDAI